MAEGQLATCAQCGQSYQLTPEHVAAYAGVGFACGRCRAQIPVHAAAIPVQPVSVAAAAYTNQAYGAQGAPVLGYASAQPAFHAPPIAGAWREGKKLVMYKGAVLPDLCVKCGEQAGGFRVHRQYYWHEPWLYVFSFIPILYFIFAMNNRKEINTFIALCPEHRAKRRNGLLTWLLGGIVGGIVLLVVGIAFAQQGLAWLCAISLVLFITAMVMAARLTRILRAARIDDTYAWLTGCGDAYLAKLPDIQQGAGGTPVNARL